MAITISSRLGFQISIGVGLVALGFLVLSQQRSRASRRRPLRDYSGRSGLPLGVEASRGIAADAPIPPDMRTPELLRPFVNGVRP